MRASVLARPPAVGRLSVRFGSVLSVCTCLLAMGCSEPPLPEAGEWTAADHVQPEREAATTNQQRAPRAERASDPLAAAAALWNVTCASCHGRAGEGNGPAAPGPLVSFANPDWQRTVSDADITQVITNGRNMMPAFGETIAPAGIEALVVLIRRFGGSSTGSSPSPSGPTEPSTNVTPAGAAPSMPPADGSPPPPSRPDGP